MRNDRSKDDDEIFRIYHFIFDKWYKLFHYHLIHLVYFLGFSQHQAQGTSLFLLLLPTGFFAVVNYYQQGYVDWKVALIISSTFLIGGFLGSKLSIAIDQNMVKKIFAGFVIIVGIKMLLGK